MTKTQCQVALLLILICQGRTMSSSGEVKSPKDLYHGCVDNIHIVPLSDGGTIEWLPKGFVMTVPDSGGFRFKLVIKFCNLTDEKRTMALTKNNTHCEHTNHQHTLEPVVPGIWLTELTASDPGQFYICLMVNGTFKHQGDNPFVTFKVKFYKKKIKMPLVVLIVSIIIFQAIAALLSGLNLGLLSLDMSDLKVLRETGSYREKYYAAKIMPLRKHGNYLLCSIVLGQTLMNAINTLSLDAIGGDVFATAIATLMITVFGEIIPQAVCSRFGLLIGAVTAPFMWLVMIITAPVSWTFGKILDKVLGKSPPFVLTRERVSFLIREQACDLDVMEKKMVEGVLSLRNKPVKNHMVKLKEVAMVCYDDRFDDKMFMFICERGYSRIPVYKGTRGNIVGVVHVKDLALLDTSHPRTIGKICDAFKLPFGRCNENSMLSELLRDAQCGRKHMTIVERDALDLKVEAVGIITLEDIIEELLSLEIMDEYDRNADEKVTRTFSCRDKYDRIKLRMPSQFKSGAVQFLSSLEPFSDEYLTTTTLCRLVQKAYVDKTSKGLEYFFRRGEPAEHFMLILSGSIIVEAGEEKLKFEAGPYCFFGALALQTTALPYVPDFSAYTDQTLKYIWLSRTDWVEARKTSADDEMPGGDGSYDVEVAGEKDMT